MIDSPPPFDGANAWNWLFGTITAALGACVVALYNVFGEKHADMSKKVDSNTSMISRVQERLHERVDEVVLSVNATQSRLAVLEEVVTHLATAKDIGQIYQRVNDVASEVSNIKGQQETIIKLLSKRVDFS